MREAAFVSCNVNYPQTWSFRMICLSVILAILKFYLTSWGLFLFRQWGWNSLAWWLQLLCLKLLAEVCAKHNSIKQLVPMQKRASTINRVQFTMYIKQRIHQFFCGSAKSPASQGERINFNNQFLITINGLYSQFYLFLCSLVLLVLKKHFPLYRRT